MAEQVLPGALSGGLDSVLIFTLAGRRYALPIGAVVQIIPMVRLTALPQAHPALAGMMTFRGQPVPVVALRTYMELPVQPLTADTPIVLIRIEGQTDCGVVGLIVDEVEGVATVEPERIAAVGAMVPEAFGRLPLLRGFLQTPEGIILVLNLTQLFLIAPSGALLDSAGDLLARGPLTQVVPDLSPTVHQDETMVADHHSGDR